MDLNNESMYTKKRSFTRTLEIVQVLENFQAIAVTLVCGNDFDC